MLNNIRFNGIDMKRIWLILILAALFAGCGKGEKDYTGYLNAMISVRNRISISISSTEYRLKIAQDELDMLRPREKDAVQKYLEEKLREKGEKIPEDKINVERIEEIKLEIAKLESEIALEKLIKNEVPDDAKKAVYIEMIAFYNSIPPAAQKEFSVMAANNDIWINGNNAALSQYPNVLHYESDDEVRQKMSEFAEKLGCRMISNRLYYDSAATLDKAYETAKEIASRHPIQ